MTEMEIKLRRKMRGWLYPSPVPPRAGGGKLEHTHAARKDRRKREEVRGREVASKQAQEERQRRRWELFLSAPPEDRTGNHEGRRKRWRRRRKWKHVPSGKSEEGGELISKMESEVESSAKVRWRRRI